MVSRQDKTDIAHHIPPGLPEGRWWQQTSTSIRSNKRDLRLHTTPLTIDNHLFLLLSLSHSIPLHPPHLSLTISFPQFTLPLSPIFTLYASRLSLKALAVGQRPHQYQLMPLVCVVSVNYNWCPMLHSTKPNYC